MLQRTAQRRTLDTEQSPSSSSSTMWTPIRVRGKNRRDQSGRSPCKSTKLHGKELTAAISSGPKKGKPGRPLKLRTRLTDGSSITSISPPNSSSSSRLNSPSASSIDSSTRTKTVSRRRGRRGRVTQLSLLECLPPELLQSIFILSDNLALPLASPFLAQSLSSHHVYTALCTRAFLAAPRKCEENPDLQLAVLRQPWFTMEFLGMIEQGLENRPPVRALPHVRLPARVVRAPWTEEKVELLQRLLEHDVQVDWVNTTIGEEAEQGLRDAILEGCVEAVQLLTSRHVGVKSSTELLKLAVFQGGCRQGIVTHLISAGLTDEMNGGPNRIDWQDAEVWQFALLQGRREEENTASEGGDVNSGRGWLVGLLKHALHHHAGLPFD